MRKAAAAALAAALVLAPVAQAGVQPWRWVVTEEGRASVVYATPKLARKTALICLQRGLKPCVQSMRAPLLLLDCRLQGMTARRLARALLRAASTKQIVYFRTERGGYPWLCFPYVGELPR